MKDSMPSESNVFESWWNTVAGPSLTWAMAATTTLGLGAALGGRIWTAWEGSGEWAETTRWWVLAAVALAWILSLIVFRRSSPFSPRGEPAFRLFGAVMAVLAWILWRNETGTHGSERILLPGQSDSWVGAVGWWALAAVAVGAAVGVLVGPPKSGAPRWAPIGALATGAAVMAVVVVAGLTSLRQDPIFHVTSPPFQGSPGQVPETVTEHLWTWSPPQGQAVHAVYPTPAGAVAAIDDGAVGLDPVTGEELWHYRVRGESALVDALPDGSRVVLRYDDFTATDRDGDWFTRSLGGQFDQSRGDVDSAPGGGPRTTREIVLDSSTGAIVHEHDRDMARIARVFQDGLATLNQDSDFVYEAFGDKAGHTLPEPDEDCWGRRWPIPTSGVHTLAMLCAQDEETGVLSSAGDYQSQLEEFEVRLAAIDPVDGQRLWERSWTSTDTDPRLTIPGSERNAPRELVDSRGQAPGLLLYENEGGGYVVPKVGGELLDAQTGQTVLDIPSGDLFPLGTWSVVHLAQQWLVTDVAAKEFDERPSLSVLNKVDHDGEVLGTARNPLVRGAATVEPAFLEEAVVWAVPDETPDEGRSYGIQVTDWREDAENDPENAPEPSTVDLEDPLTTNGKGSGDRIGLYGLEFVRAPGVLLVHTVGEETGQPVVMGLG